MRRQRLTRPAGRWPTTPLGRTGLAGRLFAAQIVVVLTGSVTLWLVAAVVGPPIFHSHLHQVGTLASDEAIDHIEQAYTSASAVSTGVGLLAALLAALVASAYVARRVAGPITTLAEAAADVAEGSSAVRVPPPGLGQEFDTLAEAFNTMAVRLADIEATRRRLLADLGHELRTPLATIEAYLDAAEDGVAVDDEDTLSVLRTQTARLRRLTDDVAAVSRAEERLVDMRRVRTDPAELVTAAVAVAGAAFAARGVTLTMSTTAGVPAVLADPQRMAQVLGNLLANALRHTPAGGRVTVDVAGDQTGARLTVTDTGAGIPAEHLPHLFERFYRVDTARDRGHGGSGIGLAIVRTLVQAHGGRVTAASDGPGTGATFTVTLPAAG